MGAGEPDAAGERALLIEQYKMVEKRRAYFGRMFWQIPGLFVAIFAGFLGLINQGQPRALKLTCFVGGAIFFLISWIAHRHRASQDECERLLSQIEDRIRALGLQAIICLPRSKRYGARTAVVAALLTCGFVLMLFAILQPEALNQPRENSPGLSKSIATAPAAHATATR